MITVVVDSTADVPPDLRESAGLRVVPVLMLRAGETLRDDVDISRDEYYAWLAESDEPPKTSAPTVGMFAEAFAAAGGETLAITLAGDLSATHAAAVQAAQLAGPRVRCVDSRTIGMPITYLALAAARAIAEGASLDEAAALVERLRERAVVLVALDTLRYLEKGGRISKVRALLGGILNVKPVLEVRDGAVTALEQVRTWRRVPPRLVELAQARGPFAELSVQYTTDRAAAERLADGCAAAGLLARERIHVVQVGSVLGTHVGPGALGITGLKR